jgi:hypothetical protein
MTVDMVIVMLFVLAWCVLEYRNSRRAQLAARMPWGLKTQDRDAERLRADLLAARDRDVCGSACP